MEQAAVRSALAHQTLAGDETAVAIEKRDSSAPDPRVREELDLPFCGDEYPPLKGSPGAVICTKPCHPDTEIHLNEETGWVWSTR